MPPRWIHINGEKKHNPEYRKIYYEKNREIILAKAKENYQKCKEKRIQRQHEYYQENREEILRKRRIENKRLWRTDKKFKEQEKERKKMYVIQRKIETITHYGGKCTCCGETQMEFLSIDHINGNGNEHRQKIKRYGGWNFYNWLKKNNYPEGYQVLCMNCNTAKGFYGKCPHQNEVNNND
jgi:hypothetical protein